MALGKSFSNFNTWLEILLNNLWLVIWKRKIFWLFRLDFIFSLFLLVIETIFISFCLPQFAFFTVIQSALIQNEVNSRTVYICEVGQEKRETFVGKLVWTTRDPWFVDTLNGLNMLLAWMLTYIMYVVRIFHICTLIQGMKWWSL